jgi:hypothetical protein
MACPLEVAAGCARRGIADRRTPGGRARHQPGVRRDGKVVWEKPFLTGETNMSHWISNLEHHHFKYPLFRRPGDVHVHFFGTATLSFADGVRVQPGDVFEIEADAFSVPLRNALSQSVGRAPRFDVRTL